MKNPRTFSGGKFIAWAKSSCKDGLCGEGANILMSASVPAVEHRSRLRYINSCESVTNDQDNYSLFCVAIDAENVCSTSSACEIEKHTFCVSNTEELIQKQLSLTRDEEIYLLLRAQGLFARLPMHTSFCYWFIEDVKNYDERWSMTTEFCNQHFLGQTQGSVLWCSYTVDI